MGENGYSKINNKSHDDVIITSYSQSDHCFEVFILREFQLNQQYGSEDIAQKRIQL